MKKITHTFETNIEEIGKLVADYNKFPDLSKKLPQVLKARLGKFIDITKTYVLETPYIEKDWRSLYGLHYCKTNYYSLTPFCSRLHLLSEKIGNINEMNQKDYMGYITLRPTPVVNTIISKIMLNPNREFYEIRGNRKLYMITNKYIANIENKSFEIETFPFYSQDSMVGVCAHADMLMITDLMSKKYDMNDVSMDSLLKKIPPLGGRTIPSNGLTIQQIALSLIENGYNIRVKSFEKEKIEELIRYIDAYIESGIPCILSFKRHVIIICGHTIENGDLGYIIFDDSGHHILNIFERGRLFSINLPENEFKEKLINSNDDSFFVLTPEFERLYFPIESVEKTVDNVISYVAAKYPHERERYYEYLFRWDDVPGNHEHECQLKRFLKEDLGEQWVSNARIEKLDDKTIIFNYRERSLEIKLTEKNGKFKGEVIIKVDTGKIDKCTLFITGDNTMTYKDIHKSKLKFRTLLIESKKLKKFFSENNINDINDISLPHYIWYIELYDKVRGVEGKLLNSIIIDASAHKDDHIYSIIPSTDQKGLGYELYKVGKILPNLTHIQ